MSGAELPVELQQLIAHHLPSMDHVAVLLDLRSSPAVSHPAADVALRTRLDAPVVEKVLRELTASRIVSGEGGAYRYAPAAELREVVDRLAEMYHTKPVTLVRAIYDRPTRAVQSFADAFRIRKGDA